MLHIHPAPRGDDYVRISFDDLLKLDNPILRFSDLSKLRKNGRPAGKFDQFLYPFDSADERIIPFFEIHTRLQGKRIRCGCNLLQS